MLLVQGGGNTWKLLFSPTFHSVNYSSAIKWKNFMPNTFFTSTESSMSLRKEEIATALPQESK